MAARADFSCENCSKTLGHEVIHRDLSVNKRACPLCKRRRGFKRLYNAVNVSRNTSRYAVSKPGDDGHVTNYIDAKLPPIFERFTEQQAGAQRFEREAAVAFDKAYEKTPTAEGLTGTARADAVNKERAVLSTMSPRHGGKPLHVMPAAGALASITPDARGWSAERNYPALSGQFPSAGGGGGYTESGLWVPPASTKMPRPAWVRRG